MVGAPRNKHETRIIINNDSLSPNISKAQGLTLATREASRQTEAPASDIDENHDRADDKNETYLKGR